MNKIIIILIINFICNYTYCQWTGTNGPYGGYVVSIAASGNKLLAGTYIDGVFYSTNSGALWVDITDGLPTPLINSVAFKDSNIFVGTAIAGIFCSTNNGQTWNSMNNGLTCPFIQIIVSSESNLYAGTDSTCGGSLFRSTNNGVFWQNINNGIPSATVSSIVVDPDTEENIFAGTYGAGVFFSSNYGSSWMPVNNGLTSQDIYSIAINYTTVFVATGLGGIFRSTNYGMTWSNVYGAYVRAMTIKDSKIYAGGSEGVFCSINNGASWDQINNGLVNLNIYSLVSGEEGIYAGTFGGGMYFLSNNSDSWIPVNDGLSAPKINALLRKENKIFAGTEGGGVFISSDNGENWIGGNAGLEDVYVKSLLTKDNKIFAGTLGGIFVSSDEGVSWIESNAGLTDLYVNVLTAKEEYIFAGTYDGIFRSQDSGETWYQFNNGIGFPNVIWALTNDSINVYTVAFNNGYFSSDYGENWIIMNGLNYWVNTLAANENSVFAGVDFGILCSTDHGLTWFNSSSGIYGNIVYSIKGLDSNLFAGTYHNGVFHSSNNGLNWSQISPGLGSQTILSIDYNDDYLFIGTERNGVWKRPLSEMIIPVELVSFSGFVNSYSDVVLSWTTSTEMNNSGFDVERLVIQTSRFGELLTTNWEKIGFVGGNGTTTTPREYSFTDKNVQVGKYIYRLNQIDFDGSYNYSKEIEVDVMAPNKFSLEQNYPNPFNPTTKIKYSIPSDGYVSLTVYNTIGQKVSELVNGEVKAGSYEINFDASDLSSGIYFYKIQADGYTSTKKMMLLR